MSLNYKESIIGTKNEFINFKMYSIDGLIKDNKLIETKSFKEWIEEMIEMCGIKDTKNPLEELKIFWDDMGMSNTFEEECINQKVSCMMRENKLVYNPALQHGGYYIPDEVVKTERFS